MTETILLVIPVRFSGGGLSMQTTTGRIGAKNVFVRSLISPRKGAPISLKLALPGSARMLDAAGVVSAESESSLNEQGFWVDFDALPQQTRGFLQALLERRRVQSSFPAARADPTSRRTFARMPARLRVGCTSFRKSLVAWSENISRGGIFLATEDPPPLHEIVELSVELPDGKPPARTHAEVVQRVTAQDARTRGGIAGVGLQFIGGNDEFRQRLDACVEALSG